MAQVRCPKCGKSNPADAEVCKFCAAPLKPQAAKPVIAPTSKSTQPVKPGEAPKTQNTADLEPGLPDWLRELRGDQTDPAQNQPSGRSEEASPDIAAPAEKADEVPDWLARIRRSHSTPNQDSAGGEDSPSWMTTEDKSQVQPGSKDETEDWFARLRSPDDEKETPSAPVKPPVPGTADLFENHEEAGIPDWLSSLGSDEPSSKPAEAGKAPEWLGSLGQPPSSPSLAHETPAESSSESDATVPFDISLPDWLADLDKSSPDDSTKLNSTQQSTPTALPPSSPPAGASPIQPPAAQSHEEAWPSWLAGLEETPPGETVAPPATTPAQLAATQLPPTAPLKAALPSWLASLEETPASETVAPPAATPAQPAANQLPPTTPLEAALPSWLASLEETPASETVTPPVATPAQPAAVQPAPAAPLEEALPDWLASLGEELASETPVPLAATPAQPAATQLPPATTPVQPAPVQTPPADLEETPAGEMPVPPAATSIEPAPVQLEAVIPPKEELPDWLAGLGGISTEENITPPAPSAAPADISAAQTEMPSESQELDWLFSHPETPSAATGAGVQPAESAGELPDWLTGQPSGEQTAATPAGKLPDWLAEAKPAASPPPSDAAQDNLLLAEEGTMPDWLLGLQAQQQPASWESTPPVLGEQPTTEEEGHAAPFVSDELPDWLSRIEPSAEETPAKPAAAMFKEEEKEQSGLEPAELPNWVQAMRPIEMGTPAAPIPVEVDERVEKTGPLAGLRGIIPTVALSVDARKSGFQSIKLQLTDKQRINSASFDSLIAGEAQPQQIETKGPRLTKNLLNIIVALLLIIAILLPVWNGGQIMSLPGFTLPETSAVQDAITALPSNSTVLVAVDYEPANVGEMEAASVGVISSLMSKSTNLILISTNPTGQVLGDQLLIHAANQQADYQINDKTVNLGYLAGGTAALYNFAMYPQLAAPVTADLQAAWNQPIMANLNHGDNPLANLAQIIVITPDMDTARVWIEQVAPVLPNVPLFILTSAQTAPMLKPYLDSGQVKGSVAGITGGTIFEHGVGKPSTSQSYWDAYQAGILLLVFLILLGGLVNIADVLINRRKLFKGK